MEGVIWKKYIHFVQADMLKLKSSSLRSSTYLTKDGIREHVFIQHNINVDCGKQVSAIPIKKCYYIYLYPCKNYTF